MKVKPLGRNLTVVTTPKYEVLFSYETPVAAKELSTGKYLRTDKKWSVTTSKQINQWLAGATAETQPQSFFDNLNEEAKQAKNDPVNMVAESLSFLTNMHSLNESFSDEESQQETEDDLDLQEANSKISPFEAHEFLTQNDMLGKDFFELNSDKLSVLMAKAKEVGYRKSKYAPGSTGRMFFYYLDRLASKWTKESVNESDDDEDLTMWMNDENEETGGDTQYDDQFYVFDNGGRSLDRYTIILASDYDNQATDHRGMIPVLISGVDPRGISGHEEASYSDLQSAIDAPEMEYGRDTFLGDRIEFSSLPKAVYKFALRDYADELHNMSETVQENSLNESSRDWYDSNVMDSRDLIERINELERDEESLDDDEKDELETLRQFEERFGGYGDWEHGESIISVGYWVEYCKELISDIGDLPRDLPSYIENNINWDGVADDLSADYVSEEIDGTTWYMRA